jgi:hypothetical protein
MSLFNLFTNRDAPEVRATQTRTDGEIDGLIAQLRAQEEVVTYVEDMSRERYMYNSPSIRDQEHTETRPAYSARSGAEDELGRLGSDIAARLIRNLLQISPVDADYDERVARLLASCIKAEPQNISPARRGSPCGSGPAHDAALSQRDV